MVGIDELINEGLRFLVILVALNIVLWATVAAVKLWRHWHPRPEERRYRDLPKRVFRDE